MPIYEYWCKACGKKSSVFVRSISMGFTPRCDGCGSQGLERLVSGFAYHKSMKTIHEEGGEPTMFPRDDYYKDPRNIGRWTEKRLEELGIEMPEETRKMIDAAREGEMPAPLKDL
jgi:putative FmdB family regulatory protein